MQTVIICCQCRFIFSRNPQRTEAFPQYDNILRYVGTRCVGHHAPRHRLSLAVKRRRSLPTVLQ